MRRTLLTIGAFFALLLVAGMATVFVLTQLRSREIKPPRLESLRIERLAASEEKSGSFELRLEDGGDFEIRHPASPTPVFANVPGKAFVIAGTGGVRFVGGHGMFRAVESIDSTCSEQFVDQIHRDARGVAFSGHLNCHSSQPIFYRLTFVEQSPNTLDFVVELVGLPQKEDEPKQHWVSLVGTSDADEGFFGFGEQFDALDMKGRRLPIVVSEQGVGRGIEPLTTVANLLADGIGGDWHSTYAPVPQFITNRNRGLYLHRHHYSAFDLRRPDRFEVRTYATTLRGRFIVGEGPLALIETYTAAEGRMRALPDWVHSGAILGVQGGTEIVREKVQRATAAGVPIAGVWMQDWSGQRMDGDSKRLWWNWVLDDTRYPDWAEMVFDFAHRGIRILTYVNPYLSDVSQVFPDRRNLFAEARDQGFLVTEPGGAPHVLESGGLTASPLDLTNADARTWMKAVIRDEVIGMGATGWMADFGEAMPLGLEVMEGRADISLHNRYPELWAELHREVIEELGLGDYALFFVRSGYTASPRHATLFWLGDQMASWDAFDGIKSAVTGLQSSGLSGFAYNHSDIGGYMTVPGSLAKLLGADSRRSPELFQRWTELAAFTAVFRTHEGNMPDANHQFDSSETTLTHFANMAKLYTCLAPHRKRLAREVSDHGWPLVRPLWLHYPNDERARALTHEQFLLGADLLVAPALDPGITEVDVYLPDDGWQRIGTTDVLDRGRHRVDARIGRPAAFSRAGSEVAAELANPHCAALVQ